LKGDTQEVAMPETKQNDPKAERKQQRPADDPTRRTERQTDDNQDDMGRDVNDPSRVTNEVNKKGH